MHVHTGSAVPLVTESGLESHRTVGRRGGVTCTARLLWPVRLSDSVFSHARPAGIVGVDSGGLPECCHAVTMREPAAPRHPHLNFHLLLELQQLPPGEAMPKRVSLICIRSRRRRLGSEVVRLV